MQGSPPCSASSIGAGLYCFGFWMSVEDRRRIAEICVAGLRTAQLLEPQRLARGRVVAEALTSQLYAEKVLRWSVASASPTGQGCLSSDCARLELT